MPAILTHYTFGKEHLAEGSLYPKATLLGSQGPDIFFFYGYVPWRPRKPKGVVSPFGSFIHHTDISTAYAFMLSYAAKSPDKELLFAYLEGLFMHYLLDRNCHPLVFFCTGFGYTPKEHRRSSLSHTRYETVADVIVARRHGTFMAPSKALAIDKAQCAKISAMWAAMAHSVYPEVALGDDSYLLARRDYSSIEKTVYSPCGVKKGLFRLLGPLGALPYNMSYPRNVDKYVAIDILNEKHAEWLDPTTGVSHRESFFDLYDRAGAELIVARKIISDAKSGADVGAELGDFVNGIDHDGFKLQAKKINFGICWDRLK